MDLFDGHFIRESDRAYYRIIKQSSPKHYGEYLANKKKSKKKKRK